MDTNNIQPQKELSIVPALYQAKSLLLLLFFVSQSVFCFSNQPAGNDSASFKKDAAITGIVYDENGHPMIGVSIKYKSCYNSVLTDSNGKYILPAPSCNNDKIVASYVGYLNKEVKAVQDSAIIHMKPNAFALDSVEIVYNKRK